MGGRRDPYGVVPKAIRQPGPVALELKGLSANKDNGVPAVSGVNLSVCEGEVVGIAGISGNGQRELVEVLAGQRPATGGEIHVHGQPYWGTRAEAFGHQVFLLPEEPLRNGCVPQMSVAENIAFRSFDRTAADAGSLPGQPKSDPRHGAKPDHAFLRKDAFARDAHRRSLRRQRSTRGLGA